MKNQLANYFEIILKNDVSTIDGVTITPRAGKSLDKIYTKNNITILEKPAAESDNPYFQQSSKMVCPKLSSEESAKYRNNHPVIMVLYYTDHTSLVWGSLELPVRVQLNPEINHDLLEMTRKSPESLL